MYTLKFYSKGTSILGFIMCILLCSRIFGQEEKVFILHEKVGEVIDIHEFTFYKNLFFKYEDFESAQFFQLPDSTYSLKINFQKDENETIVKNYTEAEVKKAAEYIEHFEAIQAGTYIFKPVQTELKYSYSGPQTKKFTKAGSVNSGIFAGEFLAGTLGSAGLGILGIYIGVSMASNTGWFSGLIEGFFGGVIGSTLGSSIGVYLIGSTGDVTGSYGKAFLGSLTGTLVSLGIVVITREPNLILSIPIFQTAFAMSSFNASRKKEFVFSGQAIINYKDGQLSFSTPQIKIKPNPMLKGDWIKEVNLITLEL